MFDAEPRRSSAVGTRAGTAAEDANLTDQAPEGHDPGADNSRSDGPTPRAPSPPSTRRRVAAGAPILLLVVAVIAVMARDEPESGEPDESGPGAEPGPGGERGRDAQRTPHTGTSDRESPPPGASTERPDDLENVVADAIDSGFDRFTAVPVSAEDAEANATSMSVHETQVAIGAVTGVDVSRPLIVIRNQPRRRRDDPGQRHVAGSPGGLQRRGRRDLPVVGLDRRVSGPSSR